MIFWVDAQLPPGFAPWLTETFPIQANSLQFLGLRDANDREIFEAARHAEGDVVIVSKDSDFVELVLRLGVPPKILWVTCGNLTNQRLRAVFNALFPQALIMLEEGEAIVEITDTKSQEG
uniref:Predicted nuclease, contains PIN domain, potential toxin-antitoxin system component n=1 Tax=Candidatus Kentrum sp. SD TaxID=2126332 RepID=A0A450YTF3_9GAMM|nr:MAG: Predicted nuclease, contains PIN domain, potential toxin-antitoxin system component [Candidatus Kentron sp. SD]VFK44838.1 MAG: Predicted nuclease, contains PIN domain, potential toxin-antitoxin system component [Candidatus Kentron sp. SD]VFK80045.1 MAG: Predicted nuclease, contains PIN domain, potential toxin-antitoxin system component [Candidatus Kentron sp. SD]